MLKTTTSKNLNGTSTVDDGEMKGVIVASMYASISEDGNININKTITNKEMSVIGEVFKICFSFFLCL